MILLINICKEEMHYLEFVKPIQDILKNSGIEYQVKHYSALSKDIIEKSERIIICGTSLQDFRYMDHKERFDFIKTCNKPILGICGGMQLIALSLGCRLTKGKEIGPKVINFEKEFLGIEDEREVYCLHNQCVADNDALKENFDTYSKTECIQAIRHKEKQIYAVLFHPEVRNKDMIINFCKAKTD